MVGGAHLYSSRGRLDDHEKLAMLFALGVLFVVSSPALPMPPENAVHLMLISSSADGEEHCLEDGVLPAVQLAVDHVNDNEEILKNYQLSIVMKENSSLLVQINPNMLHVIFNKMHKQNALCACWMFC